MTAGFVVKRLLRLEYLALRFMEPHAGVQGAMAMGVVAPTV